MTEKNSGFDPTVVAQFFRTLEEHRTSNADFQRRVLAANEQFQERILAAIDRISQDLKEVRKELAEGNRTFGVLENQIKTQNEWRDKKEAECRRHQAETADLHDEMLKMKAAGQGMSLTWRIIIGALAFLAAALGILNGWKILSK